MNFSPPKALADRLLALRRVAVDHFREEDWRKLASQTSTETIVGGHNPPLGRVNWGEEAYDALVLEVLERIAQIDESNIDVFEEYAVECCSQKKKAPFCEASLLRLDVD